ncbi:HdrA4 [Desulfamplus magnetovallimortis]|uniref:HdrA4 n=1 Tax=Desulfamplus magnetovallimortis TaxID=1246637 RepID=A0A1W1H6I1_9BACT|nr:response regulator [Desulfamplus magnetovallimortis]SLM28062.1 HdrA4 [Desulfamplus magnetovallimortis]
MNEQQEKLPEKGKGAIVVGAGIGGIRSALDLADAGHHVTLIEKAPHMGGILSKLDYQFPTDRCGMCRMLPMMHRDSASQYCLRRGLFHDNIDLMLSTTIEKIEGESGNYTVQLRQKKQYVNPELCTGCGECTEVCPVGDIPDRFNEGSTTHKAIYLPLPHAIPKRYTIDINSCTLCGACVDACPENAITLPEDQKKNFRILVVDDELIVRDSIKEWFDFEGYPVDMAESGQIALEMIEKNEYSLMLLDIRMAEMEGTEVLKRAKEIAPELQVVMMTAYATVETAVETMKRGALEYIIKPFDPDTLIEKVNSIYQSGRQSDDVVMEVDAGALIMACGTDYYNPDSGKNTFGYKVYPDVITSLEFERMVSGSGATGGEIIRPSNGEVPKRIAWIQCVGSRDVHSGASYCSSVCCMFALKEAVLTRKRSGGTIETVIYYMDMRCFGKEFEAYRKEAEEKYQVILKRIRPHSVRMDNESGKLRIFIADSGVSTSEVISDSTSEVMSDSTSEVISDSTPDTMSKMPSFSDSKKDEVFDMVVLSVGQRPSSEAMALSELTGVPLNEFGFPETGVFPESALPMLSDSGTSGGTSSGAGASNRSAGGTSNKNAIFVGGAFGGLKDISESVIHASAAAAEAMKILNQLRGNRAPLQPEFRNGYSGASSPILSSEVKITSKLAAFRNPGYDEGDSSKGNAPGDVKSKSSGSAVGQKSSGSTVTQMIKPVSVEQKVLIIGAGISGMTAALLIADSGYKVILVEKKHVVGGNLNWLASNLNGNNFPALLAEMKEKIDKHPLIFLYSGWEVVECRGEVGNFSSTIEKTEEKKEKGEAATNYGGIREVIKHGAVIIATGASEADTASYSRGKSDAIITLKQMQEALNNTKTNQIQQNLNSKVQNIISGNSADVEADATIPVIDFAKLETVVMIQCVDSRDEIKPYCSRVCCTSALKHALSLKKINPDIDIYILYRDMMSPGFTEKYYNQARESGIIFIQYTSDKKPQVYVEKGNSDNVDGDDLQQEKQNCDLIKIRLDEPVIGRTIEISGDLLVLATGVVPSEAVGFSLSQDSANSHLSLQYSGLAEIMGIKNDEYHFFRQADSKWRPVDSTREGIFICGTAIGPRDVEESIISARAAAMRAMCIITHDKIQPSSVTAGVKTSLCSLCLRCVDTCPYDARHLNEETMKIDVNAAMCQGCGACAAICPNSASFVSGFTDQQMFETIDAAIGY